jgi:hypothetical protein
MPGRTLTVFSYNPDQEMMTMRSAKSKCIHVTILLLLFSITSFAYSQDIEQYFEIETGVVTTTPGFCPPDECGITTSELSGTFSAAIDGDVITFSNANVFSTPDVGFYLLETPNDVGFATITFNFDGLLLVVNGSIDTRPVDGPLYEYQFTARLSETTAFDAKGYYTARQDFRKCISPICGGLFVKSVNRRYTKCSDGSRQEECYVASLNWSKLGFDPFSVNGEIYSNTPILLKGELMPKDYNGFGNLGEFVATDAYRPATNNPPKGKFTALINNGIVCITAPCFSIDEYRLNTRRLSVISGFDLNPVGASDKDLAAADALFSNKLPLIVAGYNKQQEELGGIGVSFIANQLYLPIKPALHPCIDGYQLVNGLCTTPHGCIAPLIEMETVRGSAGFGPATGVMTENTSYRCVPSCTNPAFRPGPVRCMDTLSQE